MTEPPGGPVRAAGGVVWRRAGAVLQFGLVHRPHYGDWTFPKGKAEAGETDEECAVREVKEETGLVCALGPELPTVNYTDRHGRPKVVRYWSMTVTSGCFRPNREVDQLRWVEPDAAGRLLTYPRDLVVVDAFMAGHANPDGTLPV